MSKLGYAARFSLALLAPTLMAGCFQWDWSAEAPQPDGGMDAGPSDAGPTDAGPTDAGCTEDYCVNPVNLYECAAMTLVACSNGCVDGACVLPSDAGPTDAGTWLPCCIDRHVQSCFCAPGDICEQGQFSFDGCDGGRCETPLGTGCPSAG
jgi:hypothetical protein